MKLRAPTYYKNFHCIADKCNDSCCSAGWEIDIDENTAQYYENIDGEFGEKLKKNINLNSEKTSKCFTLDNNNNCPFLNNKKLCDIYINLGEDKLCTICKEHPRFYEWFNNVKEVGIGLCCEEAARIILSQDKSFDTYETEIPFEDCDFYTDELYEFIFNVRKKIINYIDNSNNLDASIKNILWYCNTIQQNIDIDLLEDEEIFEIKTQNKSDITKIIKFFTTLEPNDNSYPSYLNNCLNIYINNINKFFLFEKNHQEIWGYLKNISIYFIWRYFLKGVFDEEIISKISFMAISIAILKVLYFGTWIETGDLTLENCINITKKYSEEIEYSDENLQKIFDACYDSEHFSIDNLINLF